MAEQDSITFDEVVKTEEDVERLLDCECIKMSTFRIYAELEHILYGMSAQKTFINLIEFLQDGNIMHAVYIGRYGLPRAANDEYFPGQGYWILYGHGMHYSDKDREIKNLRELIQKNGIKHRCVKVENDALERYWEMRGFIETKYFHKEA